MFNNNKKSKGISVFIAIIILSVLLFIALGLSAILIGQIKMVRGMGDSIIAFFAADTGVERVLYIDKKCRSGDCGEEIRRCLDMTSCNKGIKNAILNGSIGAASYSVSFDNGALLINSIGIYKGTRRGIKVTR